MTTSQVKRKREDSDNEKEPIKTENDTKPKKGNMENGAAATSQPKSNGVKEKPKLAGTLRYIRSKPMRNFLTSSQARSCRMTVPMPAFLERI